MIETRVRIVSVDRGTAWVEATESSGCGSCHAKSSCGISGIGKFFSGRRKPIPLACGEARPGAELVVSVAEGELLKAGLFAFLLPTVLALLGAGLAASLDSGDALAVLGAGLGFAAGLSLARFLAADPQLRVGRTNPSLTSGDAS